ncbi:HAMP domain-containing sensor histidine kinase [Paenibacillus aurantius]|uniref:histidine kinase n=1 Tax=Paenibacillus aurantius TaxID=2918900 RepID=A0AA96RFN6_9BACL|nr:HAMP domain-containing sensor histidine kinase [Paenibacillus aurantius]WNQ09194.1 HAMP domain-containing sensor histidine kinase [Paenibacillus aurantius]
MIKRWYGSLYLKLFLSFLAVCLLFFLGLALFWNSYFNDLFYKDKKELLLSRAEELTQVLKSQQEGTLSNRELRFGLRLVARSFNGQVWVADPKGLILYSSSPEWEGHTLPRSLDSGYAQALKGGTGFLTGHIGASDGRNPDNYLTCYSLVNGQQSYLLFLHTPVNDISEIINAVRFNIWIPLLFSLLAVGLILYILSRRLAKPLQQMNRASLALAEGDFRIRVDAASEDEVGQLARSFNFMAEQLQQWEDTRQEFLTNISHELRSPLTTLRGLIAAMNDGVIPKEDHPRYLKICGHEVQRLQRLVNDLLDLAKIQNSPDPFHLTAVDVFSRTRDIIDLLAPAFDRKELRLQVWTPEQTEKDEPLFVELDPDRYAQVVNNLLYNAMQFTPAGGEVTVWLGTEEGRFLLKVKDTGIGMSPEEIARIWDRFYKADASRGLPSEGTGLGLTITRHLVTGMGGTIEVASVHGEGTEFTVSFPLFR